MHPGIYPGYYPTKNLCKFCRTFIPVPGTFGSSLHDIHTRTPEILEVLYARDHNTRGTGTACFVPARNFREFCTPAPQHRELVEVLQDFRIRTRNFWKICKIPIPLPGTSATRVRLWHNTRGTGVPLLQYPGSPVLFQVKSEVCTLCVMMS